MPWVRMHVFACKGWQHLADAGNNIKEGCKRPRVGLMADWGCRLVGAVLLIAQTFRHGL